MKKEFSIMPEDDNWFTYREYGTARHEIFFGTRNRKKSIEDGLVIFLPHRKHNLHKDSIHENREFDLYAKKIGQKVWMEHYNKTEDEFRVRFGRSYLKDETN